VSGPDRRSRAGAASRRRGPDGLAAALLPALAAALLASLLGAPPAAAQEQKAAAAAQPAAAETQATPAAQAAQAAEAGAQASGAGAQASGAGTQAAGAGTAAAAKGKGPRIEEEPRTPEASERELLDFTTAHQRWREENEEFRKDVQLLIERKYEERRAKITSAFEAQLKDLEADERVLRKSAIERFEAFIARYPEEPRTTPDAMFRLAELYFEESKDQQRLAQKQYEELLKKLPPGEEPPPDAPVKFDKSIALYRRLEEKFPAYKLADGVHYLLAYVLEQQGDLEESRDTFAQLVEQFPQSRFVPEAWMRIGEYWFDNTGADANAGLAKAAEAYTHVTQYPEGTLYDKGLYKLGWTYYRLDQYDQAVDAFVKLIDAYEARAKAEETPEGQQKQASGELREEALQYTAISFADETWGGVEKAKAFFGKGGQRRWESEFWRKLGDIYFDQTKHAPAIECYQIVLSKDPAAPFAPQLQQRIVQAWERDRDFEKAWQARDALVKQFGEGSPWFEANKKDPEVLAKTRDLMERSLYGSAVFHHQQAQTYKKAQKYELALKEFQAAALAYGTYLDRFPHARNLYETRFFHAETLYNSLRFEEAAAEYAKVRDDNTDGRYLNDASYSVVLSLQKEIDRLERAGKLDTLPFYKAAERPADANLKPIELEELWQRQVAAADAFIRVMPKDEKAPELLFKSGETYYRHNQFDEARRRFKLLIDTYPASPEAEYAGNLTLETFLAEQDWNKVEAFSSEQLRRGGKKLEDKRRGELSTIQLGARFKRATALMDEKKYEEAAKLFIQAVDDDPKVEFADKALNNAAFCYQQAYRFESAIKLYERLFTQYPQSPLADASVFLVGFAAEKAFDFDKAIDRYELLVDKYAQSPKRADALFNLAHALERLQRYPEAQRAYVRYAQTFPDKEDAPAMLFTGALVAERTKNWKQEIADLTDYIRRFKKSEKEKERIVLAYLKIGLAFKQLGSEGPAKSSFQDAVSEFDQRKLTPADLVGAAAAAEARFNLAEIELASYDRLKIEARGRGTAFEKSLKAALNKKAEEREKALGVYKEVAFKYKRPDWVVAALYRAGYLDERFAAALNEAPIPPEIRKAGEEYVAQYQDQLAQLSVPIDERALDAYKKALQTARDLKIANEWTRRILESLDKYDHKSFPLLKDPKVEYLLEPLSPTPLLLADGTPRLPPPEAPPDAPPPAAPALPAPAGEGK
jgi:cellulose synthase operon protein C